MRSPESIVLPTPSPQNPWLSHLADPVMEARQAQATTCVAPLAHRAILRASGAEANDFLQGQLSCDMRRLSADQALLGACSSPKGRMLATLQLGRDGEDVTLALHRSVAVDTLKRLRMFVLRAKLTLELEDQAVPALGLWGPNAVALLESLGLPAPATPLAVATHAGRQIIRHHGDNARFELRAPQATLAQLWAQLAQQAQSLGNNGWRLLDVLAGIPTIYPQTRDHFVAQMTNLDLLDGISFDKGCYTGQEIIARLHFLGRLKRRMFLLRADGAAPAPGTAVLLQEQNVGEVVDAARSDGAHCVIAAVLKLEHAASAELRLDDGNGTQLSTPAAFARDRPPLSAPAAPDAS